VTDAVARIKLGKAERIALGNLDAQRDWGYAADYVEAMWRMLQQPSPRDIVIATGTTHRLQDFVAEAFALHGLDWKDHVDVSQEFFRPTDIAYSGANPSLALSTLGWQAQVSMPGVVARMNAALGAEGAPTQVQP
jgi:GDPmannose 4,6-dehydratase